MQLQCMCVCNAKCDSGRWWNERRNKTANTIDSVSERAHSRASEMRLAIIIQQVNDDTEKRSVCDRANAMAPPMEQGKKKKEKKTKSRHTAKVFLASTWLLFSCVFLFFLFRFFFCIHFNSFLVQFLRFHSSDVAYAVFLSSFCGYLHLYSAQVSLPIHTYVRCFARSLGCWTHIYLYIVCNCAIVMRIQNNKESKRSRKHSHTHLCLVRLCALASARSRTVLSHCIRNWWKMDLETLI